MSVSRRLLVITRYFPPGSEIGGKRIANLCAYLPELGVQPIVLTVKEKFYESRDETFPPPDVRVIRTSFFSSPLLWAARVKRWILLSRQKKQGAQVPGFGSSASWTPNGLLFRALSPLFFFPDHHVGWYLPAIHTARRLIRSEPFDAILSSGPPWTSHLIARNLKREFDVPWLADFRDPWTFDSCRESENLPRWREHLDQRLERSFISSADRVISATHPITNEFASRYPQLPRAKFTTIFNGFGDSLLSIVSALPVRKPSSKRRLLLHLGTVYGDRRIDTFCAAISQLVSSGKWDPREFKVIFAGSMEDPLKLQQAQAAAPELFRNGCIELQAPVKWAAAQELLYSADLLLAFQGANVFAIPGKFYEYLLSGIPVIAITKPGALSAVIAQTGAGLSADPNDAEDIGNKLLQAQSFGIRSREEVMQSAAPFHFRSLARQFSVELNTCLDTKQQLGGGRLTISGSIT